MRLLFRIILAPGFELRRRRRRPTQPLPDLGIGAPDEAEALHGLIEPVGGDDVRIALRIALLKPLKLGEEKGSSGRRILVVKDKGWATGAEPEHEAVIERLLDGTSIHCLPRTPIERRIFG